MLSRLVFTASRGVAVAVVHSSRQVRLQHVQSAHKFVLPAISRVNPPVWIHTRQYSTQRQGDQQEGQAQEQDKTKQNQETESTEEELNTQKKKEGEEEVEVKDDEPIEEPEWKQGKARPSQAFQKQSTGGKGQQEAKMPESMAYVYLAMGLGCIGIVVYKMYNIGSHAMKENSADPNLIIRKSLDQLYKLLDTHHQVIDKAGTTPSQPGEPLVNFQGNVVTVSIPLYQVNSNGRLGTIYMDLAREGDFFTLRGGYIDFFWGKTFDLIEAGILKPDEFHFFLFAPEFSMAESMKQQYEAAQAQAEAQQRQQPPQQLQR